MKGSSKDQFYRPTGEIQGAVRSPKMTGNAAQGRQSTPIATMGKATGTRDTNAMGKFGGQPMPMNKAPLEGDI